VVAGLALLVPRERAEAVRSQLLQGGLLDPTRRIVDRGVGVVLPVRSPPDDPTLGQIVAEELPPLPRLPPPMRSILAAAQVPDHVRARFPRKWERLGDIVIVRVPPDLWDYRSEVGRAYGIALGATSVLADVGSVVGPMREPRSEPIWGGSTETVHIENGVRFKFDASRIMFSSGNLRERIRMAGLPATGEVVADLFAGIGYFAVPIAVRSRAKRVVACEINPVAYEYLEENCRLNRATAVEPRLGDCRTVAPRGEADRVVMGYLNGAPFLPTGVAALRPEGGWLHYHETCPDASRTLPADRVASAARDAGFRLAQVAVRRLKSYGPRVGHWVVDAKLQG